ncbi:hypothetical protein ABZP36_008678 [Zizania latifolia]
MDEFTFPSVLPGSPGGRQCKIPASLRSPHHLQLGLGSSPPPWYDDGDGGGGGGEKEEEEEKMDMLWEDFNEELASTPPVCPLSPLHVKGGGMMLAKEAWLDVVDDDGGFGFIAAGEQKTTGSARHMHAGSVVRRRRRWNVLLILRLLKKLFLVKNTRNPRTAQI